MTPPPFPVADLRAYLAGPWRVWRHIDDRSRGERGSFEGEAIFADEGPALRYREEGRLSLRGFEGEGTRGYVFAFPTASMAEVSAEDGRLIHTLDLSGGTWRAEHRCGDDLYRGSFRAMDGNRWRATWHVIGPRKDWLLDTVYSRKTG